MQVLSAAVARPAACRPLAARAAKRLASAIGRRAIATRTQTGSGGLTEEGRRAATRDAADRFRADQLFDLSGSTAFITGGAQGIGAAIALGFAQHGANIVIADIANEDKAAEVVQAVEALGRRATFVQCDVRRRSLTDAAVLDAVKKMGVGPDILVASAGVIGRLERAENVSHDGWTEVFSVNVEGSYNAAHAVYPHMVKAGRGKVVFISSIAGIRGAGTQVAYAASKGALLPLARSLASAWGKDNIQVNTLLPGAINTPFLNTMLANPRKLEYILGRIPLGRIGVAQDMVGPALFLASHASDYVTGAEILVDGGGAALPMLAAQDPDAYKA